MAKNFTLLLLVFVTISASAQFDVGQRLLGGNVSFYSGKDANFYNTTYETKQTNVFVNPSISWFRKPNVLVGVD